MEFLKKPNQYDTPVMLKRTRHTTYDPDAYFAAKDIWDQLVKQDDIFLNTADSEPGMELPWVFDRLKFKKIITQSLPIKNYFLWSNNLMKNEITKRDFDFDKFFAMSALIFDDDYEIRFDSLERTEVKFKELTLDVPNLTVDRKVITKLKQEA